MRCQTFDVIVVGGGLAGMMAALAARGRGAQVALLADGGGALELSSGSIDLLAGAAPWAGIEQLPPGHPYWLVGAVGVREALARFTEVYGQPYAEAPDRQNQWLVTAVGALRETYLAAPGAAVVDRGGAVRVIGFRGMAEFNPEVVAAGLPGATAEWVDLPDGTVHPLQVARRLEDPAYRKALADRLPRRSMRAFFPAVLGLDGAEAVRADLSAALGAPVAEVPLLAPSLPGLRLAARLSRRLQRAGVELCLGVRATGATTEGDRVRSVTGQTAAGAVEYRARAFVLATGGLLGRGLEVRERRLCETILGLPVEAPASGAPWAEPDLFAPDGHAFLRAGVRTDQSLRPAGWTNLHICGKLLAGYDPYREGCGGGVAIATGWKAGELAGGAAS